MKAFLIGFLRLVFRLINKLMGYWALLLIALLFFLDIQSPHIRWDYTYRVVIGGEPVYTTCRYIGLKGIITPKDMGECPVIMLLNPVNERRI